MQIRLANSQDLPQLRTLFNNFKDHFAILANKEVPETNQDLLKTQEFLINEALADKNHHFLVAENEDNLVGLMYYFVVPRIHRGDKIVIVYTAFVESDFQRKGIGSQMMSWLKDWCLKKDIHVIKLDSALELTNAHKFYEKQGGVFTEKMYRFDF